jgi:hypothetical protein
MKNVTLTKKIIAVVIFVPSVFVTVSHFHPSQIYLGKASSLPELSALLYST